MWREIPRALVRPALLVTLIAARPGSPAAVGVGALQPGRPVERTLASDEVHTYAIAASPGELLRITVDERGADVAARLYGTGGSLVQEVEGPGDAGGLPRLFVQAEAAAHYRLELRSAVGGTGGRYRIVLRRYTVPLDQAGSWVAAERAFAEAQRRQDADEEGRRQALALYGESRAAWRRFGDRAGEAETLVAMAGVGGFMEEPRRKLDCLQQALPLWRALEDRYREAWTLAELGTVHGLLGAVSLEREHHERALAAWRALGDVRGEAFALVALGSHRADVGEMQAAADLVSQGLDLGRSLGDRRLEAEGLRQLAGIRRSMGETAKAIELLERSRTLWHAVGDRYREALALVNLATGYREVGRNDQALENLDAVLALARREGHRHLTAATLANLGTHHRARKEWEKARASYAQALELFRRQGQRWDESQVLRRLGEIDEAEGRWPAAAGRYEEALRLSRETAAPSAESEVLYCLARLDRRRGRLHGARSRIESALAIVEGVRASVARQDLRASYLASVMRFYELAIGVSAELHRQRPGEGHAAAALHLAERARARSFLETLGEAQTHIRKGADPGLLALRRELGRALQEKAGDAKEVEGLVEQLQEVEARLRTASRLYADLVLPQPLRLAGIQREIPDDDTIVLEYALGEERSYLWLVTRRELTLVPLPGRAEIEDLARRLHRLFQAGKFETGDERRARWRRAEAEYPRLAAALSERILGPAARALDRGRLVIVADGALQYVPFAALPLPEGHPGWRRGVGAVPLLTAHEIVSLPSASILAVLPRRPPAASRTVAVVADPVYDAADPRVAGGVRPARGEEPLPVDLQRSLHDMARAAPGERLGRLSFTRKEAEAILELVPRPGRKAALDFEASRQMVESGELADYAIVHFATHSLINDVHSELSGLVLSLVDPRGRPQDGFLRAHDIFNLELRADLVVLSGCSTGLGRETRGEGLVGLTRGFMYAGASRVLVSLWDVQDEATAVFMKRFYRALLVEGRRPAAALRAAQLASLGDEGWSAPVHWAPFVLQGDWR